MTRNFKYSEKIIATFPLLYGAVIIFVLFYGMVDTYDFALSYLHLTWKKLSILNIIKLYHSEFLFGFLSAIAGFLLLRSKKIGWMLSIIASFSTVISVVKNIYYMNYNIANNGFNKSSAIIMSCILLALFIFISWILITKPFQIKYQPTKVNWWFIMFMVGTLVVDKIVF